MARGAEPEPMKNGVGRYTAEVARCVNPITCSRSPHPRPRGITSDSFGTPPQQRCALLGAKCGSHDIVTDSSTRRVRMQSGATGSLVGPPHRGLQKL
eukprot:9479950-Pyramimonas_sp.AAC.1